MGRILEPVLAEKSDRWSPFIIELLDELGQSTWKPKKIKRGLLSKPEIIMRHLIEGPVHEGQRLRWALSHTSRPSAFDDNGILDEGERAYWIVNYQSGTFQIVGAETLNDIPEDEQALREGLQKAQSSGPKQETFYGNKGPLSHR